MRHALTIGLNYPGTASELSGCINDAHDWRDVLAARGFNVVTLLEPDKAAILSGIRTLVGKAQRNDTAVVTYSGHGTYVRDEDGDEADNADEALCPADVFAGHVLTDDELYEVFSVRERGVKLIFISDSCHSGTVSRMAPAPASEKVPRVRFLPPGQVLPSARSIAPRPRGPSKLVSSALLLSGCRDTEYSMDAWFNGRANGAFSRTAIDALRTLGPKATVREWHRVIRTFLPSVSYTQTPQLYGTSSQKRWAAI